MLMVDVVLVPDTMMVEVSSLPWATWRRWVATLPRGDIAGYSDHRRGCEFDLSRRIEECAACQPRQSPAWPFVGAATIHRRHSYTLALQLYPTLRDSSSRSLSLPLALSPNST